MRENIQANLDKVYEVIAAATRRSGRRPEEVTLVAVTKTVEPEQIMAAYQLGVREFGENRVQEAAAKIPLTKIPARWHMVGHLQTNKVRAAVGLFHTIQSVDSLRIAEAISRHATALGVVMPVLLEVNVAGEVSKYGLAVEEVATVARQVARMPGLAVEGLMTIAPLVSDPEEVRPVFRRLRQLRDELMATVSAANWRHLSMGMTDDYQVAVEEGATMVRLGRAIFGERAR